MQGPPSALSLGAPPSCRARVWRKARHACWQALLLPWGLRLLAARRACQCRLRAHVRCVAPRSSSTTAQRTSSRPVARAPGSNRAQQQQEWQHACWSPTAEPATHRGARQQTLHHIQSRHCCWQLAAIVSKLRARACTAIAARPLQQLPFVVVGCCCPLHSTWPAAS